MFRDTKKEKELIDREIALYKTEKFVEIDKQIGDYRLKMAIEMQDLAKRCSEDTGKYEHTFHSTKELKGIELAKLEAKVESYIEILKAREEVNQADNNLLKSKDVEIKRLTDIINLIIKEQPKYTIK